MIKSFAFTLYPVSNVAAARSFYEGKLGLRLTHEFGGEWFEYDLGDTTFAITTSEAAHPVPVRGCVAAFEVDNLEAELARLKGVGGAPVGKVTETPVCWFASLRDPDGSEVLLHQRKAQG